MNRAWFLFYKTTLEARPLKTGNFPERIIDRIELAFPDVSDYLDKTPRFRSVNFAATADYSFDLYLHQNQSVLHKLTGRFGEPGFDIVVKRFENTVSSDDLKDLHKALLEVYNRQSRTRKRVFDRVIALSTSGFEQDAVEYAKRAESWIPEIKMDKSSANLNYEDYVQKANEISVSAGVEFICTIDLVHESKKGYRLVWAL
jgi:hypothetical protein